MKVICSYCRKDLGEKEPLGNQAVSHSICQECSVYFSRQWEGMSLGDYLDGFDFPIVVFDKDVRVMGYNKRFAAKVPGFELKKRGLLAGEFLECQYARLPDGCGKTVHCRDCTIRRTIEYTIKTGESLHKVPVEYRKWVNNRSVLNKLTISTLKAGETIRVALEEHEAKAS